MWRFYYGKNTYLKNEWEAYIQDYKNSGLSKVAWCRKQSLPIHPPPQARMKW
ncbi:IS66 family insertion sequence element accessory protein TnpA [Bacillus yunxiaonensis]|uniref:IS66 family insertion sequence element accessory protein TnpA n=1 Tax=Bacillus yunxiaonensis TaxID=3127665 RepID=UPI0039B7878B